MLTEGFAGSLCSLRAAIGCQTSHRLHGRIGVFRVICGFALSCLFGSLLFRTSSLGPFLGGFGSLNFTRVIDELDDREFSAITVAMTEFQDARVPAGPILVTLAELVEETSQRRSAGGAFRPKLASPAGQGRHCGVTRVEKTGSLTAKM